MRFVLWLSSFMEGNVNKTSSLFTSYLLSTMKFKRKSGNDRLNHTLTLTHIIDYEDSSS